MFLHEAHKSLTINLKINHTKRLIDFVTHVLQTKLSEKGKRVKTERRGGIIIESASYGVEFVKWYSTAVHKN